MVCLRPRALDILILEFVLFPKVGKQLERISEGLTMWASIQLAEGGEPGKCSMMYKKTLVFCLFALFFSETEC